MKELGAVVELPTLEPISVRLRKMSSKELNTLLAKVQRELKSRKKKKPKRVKQVGERFRYWTLYVLRLENGNYYVGITAVTALQRFRKHKSGKGAVWTKLNPPIEIIHEESLGYLYESQAVKLETDKTLEVMKTYGIERVRGGSLVQVNAVVHKKTATKLMNKLDGIEEVRLYE